MVPGKPNTTGYTGQGKQTLKAVHAAEPSNLRSALECYSEARGLDRSLEIAADLTNLDHAASSSGGDAPSVSPAAASYVARLHHIGQGCLEESEEGRIACLKCDPLELFLCRMSSIAFWVPQYPQSF